MKNEFDCLQSQFVYSAEGLRMPGQAANESLEILIGASAHLNEITYVELECPVTERCA